MFGLAGLRALLLQALHPVAVHGVVHNSAFREDTWGRLQRTAEYVAVTTFGTTSEALVTAARVRAVHGYVAGYEPTTRRSYRGDDPDLLAWVHNCLVESTLDVLGRAGAALSDEDADTYVFEQMRSAALVGLDASEVPHDRDELRAYFDDVRPQLRATAEAREAASYVIAPPIPVRYALAARPAWSAVAGLAFAALPSWARSLYSLPDLPGASALHGAAVTVALHTMRTGLRGVQQAVPPLREAPHERSARQRLRVVRDEPGD